MKLSYLHVFALASLAALLPMTGCEESKDIVPGYDKIEDAVTGGDSDNKDNSSFEGRWYLTSSSASPWYVFFNSDKSWRICNNADGSGQRVYGNYSISGNTATGNMVNPNVGTGKIIATITNGSMNFQFIEYWHSPAKTIVFTGTKN